MQGVQAPQAPIPAAHAWRRIRIGFVIVATAGALVAGALGIETERPVYLGAAALFALVPFVYAGAALLHPTPDLSRPWLIGAGVLAAVVLTASTVVTLRTCGNLIGPDAPLSGCDFASENLRGFDLSGSDLEGANLRGADLREANLSQAVLSEVDFTGADLRDANLVGATLSGVDLSGIELRGADMSGAGLAGVDFTDADLRNANLSEANLSQARLAGAFVEGLTIDGAELTEATLSGLDISGARLDDSNLSGADLSGTSLTNAELADADLSGAVLRDSDLSEANLEGANLGASDLGGATLTNAQLADANLEGADLANANLSFVDLTDALLGGASLNGVDLTGATIKTDLSETVLDGATIRRTSLVGVTGVSDSRLADVLRVNLQGLPLALAKKDIKLEQPEAVKAALAGACSGRGSPEAASYRGGGFHPLHVGATTAPQKDLSASLPRHWAPVATRFAQLVVCVGAERREVVEVCRYTEIGTGNPSDPITRFRRSLTAELVEARTGRVVAERTFQGGAPEFCMFQVFGFYDETILGSHVGSGQIRSWLNGFVGEA